jgi:hypothetical protein
MLRAVRERVGGPARTVRCSRIPAGDQRRRSTEVSDRIARIDDGRILGGEQQPEDALGLFGELVLDRTDSDAEPTPAWCGGRRFVGGLERRGTGL